MQTGAQLRTRVDNVLVPVVRYFLQTEAAFATELATLTQSVTNLSTTIDNDIAGLQTYVQQNFAPINSPIFTGIPTAPEPLATDSSDQIATTAFVVSKIAAATTGVSAVLGFAGNVTLAQLSGAGLAASNSPTFTGTPKAPTPALTDNSTTLATTAFVQAKGYAGIISYATNTTLTNAVANYFIQAKGTAAYTLTLPVGTTMPVGSKLRIANHITNKALLTLVVQGSDVMYDGNGNLTTVVLQPGDDFELVSWGTTEWDIAGGTAALQFVQSPRVPTATTGTNTTQIASTAFVVSAIAGLLASANTWTNSNSFTGAVSINNNALTFTASGSQASIYTDLSTGTYGANDIVFRTGASGAFQLTTIDRTGTMYNPGGVVISGADPGTANLRLINANLGIMFRVSGGLFQMLQASSNAPGAAANTWRPIGWNTTSGAVTIDSTGQGVALGNVTSNTGTVSAPTPSVNDNTQRVATTAFVNTAVANRAISSIPSAFNLLLGGSGVAGTATSVSLGTGLTLNAGTLSVTYAYTLPTGTPTSLGGVKPDGTTILNNAGEISVAYGSLANTAAQGNDTRIVGALQAAVATATYAPLASANLSGIPTAPTATPGNNSSQIATTSFTTVAVAAETARAAAAEATKGGLFAVNTWTQDNHYNGSVTIAGSVSAAGGVGTGVLDGRSAGVMNILSGTTGVQFANNANTIVNFAVDNNGTTTSRGQVWQPGVRGLGSTITPNLNDFTAQFFGANNTVMTLPNGIIDQVCTGNAVAVPGGNNSVYVPFLVAFPNSCWDAVVCFGGNQPPVAVGLAIQGADRFGAIVTCDGNVGPVSLGVIIRARGN